MGIGRSIVGEVHWTRPEWLRRIGARRLLAAVGIAIVLIAAAKLAIDYYGSLPKPPRIVAAVKPPGVTPIVDDELQPMPLVVNFSVRADARTSQTTVDSVARIDLVGKVVQSGVSLDPSIPGEWRWQNENRLVFQSSEDWPAGQKYSLRFDKSIFTPDILLADDQAKFTTPAFRATLDELVFYQDPVQHAERKVVATLSFTHPVDTASLEAQLSLTMRDSGATFASTAKSLKRSIEYDKHGRTAYVHSERIAIPPQENYATLRLRKNLVAATGSGRFRQEITQTVRIPDTSTYFRVSNVSSISTRNAEDVPHQTLTFEFTDRVLTDALRQKLGAYVLPADVVINGERIERKQWSAPREVTPEVLGQARQIDIELNPVADGASQFHTANIDVPANSYVYVSIEEGLTSQGEFALALLHDAIVRATDYPREVKIAQSGAILALTGSRQLTFLSRGLDALKVDVGRIIDSEVNHLASQTGGDVKSPYFINYRFNEDNLTVRDTRYIDLQTDHPRDAVYASFDLGEFLRDGGFYFITVQGWDREKDRPVGTSDRRLVLITDLGLLVKSNADSTQDIFVHSISSGRPVAGARVALLGKNGVPIVERTSSERGHTTMPATNTFEREKTPTVFVVRQGTDSIFMPYARSDRSLQYSRFDVGGQVVRPDRSDDQLRAQVFSDRGIYRPGDTVHLASIVKSIDWRPLANLPLILRIVDPRGQAVMDERIRLPDDGFFDQQFVTQAGSATGNYRATLYLVDENDQRRSIGSESFKIEEFQPDRLRIRSRVLGQKPQGWIKPGELFCEVSLENLFGTPAEARQVTGNLDLLPSAIRIAAFSAYTFTDPLRESGNLVQHVTIPLAATETDANGIARLPLDVSQYDKGIYQLTVFTQGFEEGGGRSVSSRARVMMSPLDHLIGFGSDSDLSFLDRGSEHAVEFVAVASDALATSLADLTMTLIEEQYVSTLVRRPNGTYAYQSILQETPISTEDYAIPESGSRYVLPTGTAGTFALKISDDKGLVYSKVRYTVAGSRNLAGNLERNAELALVLNGSSFEPGAEIEMEISAPYTGTGLITIERDRVYAHKWFRSNTNTSVQKIRIPDGIEGNAYVNVSFVRELGSPEIFVSPLSYAVAPFSINRAARTIDIDLDAPDRVRPGDDLTISFSTSQPSRLALYAVDEGILQVAKYSMPKPLDYFMPKMALQVGTYQMVDLILPDFEAYQRLAAPGGGEAAGLAGSNLNPFRRKTEAPIAFWSGIVDAQITTNSISFKVPDYFNGELRIMAVAVADDAVGRSEDRTTVRGPFVITPNLLTATAPGDEFEVTVGIANNLEDPAADSDIELSVSASNHLELVGDTTASLQIEQGREGRTRFRVRAKDQLGSAQLVFEARSGSESVRRTATLSVRPSVAYVSTVVAGSADDDPIELNLQRNLYEQFARQTVAASPSPLVLADGLLEYLDVFPHLCAEQLVSKVFPQVGFLGSRDYDIDDGKIRESFAATVQKLRGRQMSNGGFQFWATSAEPQDFATVYILHFFTDAAAFGLSVPRDMLASGLAYLRQIAAREAFSITDARQRAYAIYVLTRNGTVTTNYLTNLHEYLESEHATDWRRDLAAVYMAASYELLKQTRLSGKLVGEYEMHSGNEMDSDFDTRLGRDAQYIYLLANHFPDRLNAIDSTVIEKMVEPIMQSRFNTLSSAYTILALRAYSAAMADESDLTDISITGLVNGLSQPFGDAGYFVRATIGHEIHDLAVAGADGNDVYYVLTQTGFDASAPTDAIANGLELHRDYLDENDDPVLAAKIGDELTVRLRVRSTGRSRSNVVVVDLLPGGFEVLTETVRNQYHDWYADYRDVREDRVVIYGTFGDRITELRYRVKLTSAGSFVVPSAFAGSMYDRTIEARTAPGRFEVESIQ